MNAKNIIVTALSAGVLLLHPWAMAHDAAKDEEKVTPIQLQKLPDVPGKQVVMAVVSYEPGQASSPHLHSGSVFAYVLEGEVVSQLGGGSRQSPTRLASLGMSHRALRIWSREMRAPPGPLNCWHGW